MTRPGDPVTLIIVEDEDEVREGLKYLLGQERQIRVVGAFASADALFRVIRHIPMPDVVLMDLVLPGMSGIEATTALRARWPGANVLILTVFEDEGRILDALRAGATGYLLKNTRPEVLVEQIKSVQADGSPISPTVARRLLNAIKREWLVSPAEAYHLTAREKEILKAVTDGLTYREIAARHSIAGSTARKHILHIYRKLNVSSKVEVVKKALREGLV